MKARTKITWADFTLNPWEGCTKVSEGCRHCYAENRNHRYAAGMNWGPGAHRRKSKSAIDELANINRRFGPTGDLTLLEHHETLERWIHNREPAPAGTLLGKHTRVVKPQVFSLSLGDILDPEIDPSWLAEWLVAIATATNLEFLLLTKRPERFQERMAAAIMATDPSVQAARTIDEIAHGEHRHIAWGTSVENQAATARLEALAAIPAARRFISAEPLVGPVDLHPAFCQHPGAFHLVITGGESGPQGRPMHPAWITRIDANCHLAGIPHHFKQWGEWAPQHLVELDANQSNPGNRLYVCHDGSLNPPVIDPTEKNTPQAMHRTGRKTAVAPEIFGTTQQPRLVFP